MKALKIIKWIVIGVVAIAIYGGVTMLLWNWLVPSLFNGPTIDFWQTLGLLALTMLLTWGFGRHKGSHGGYWRYRYKQKMDSMTPEERALFKERLKEKWCRDKD